MLFVFNFTNFQYFLLQSLGSSPKIPSAVYNRLMCYVKLLSHLLVLVTPVLVWEVNAYFKSKTATDTYQLENKNIQKLWLIVLEWTTFKVVTSSRSLYSARRGFSSFHCFLFPSLSWLSSLLPRKKMQAAVKTVMKRLGNTDNKR